MDTFLLVLLVIAFVWLAVKYSGRGEAVRLLEERLAQLDRRVSRLEAEPKTTAPTTAASAVDSDLIHPAHKQQAPVAAPAFVRHNLYPTNPSFTAPTTIRVDAAPVPATTPAAVPAQTTWPAAPLAPIDPVVFATKAIASDETKTYEHSAALPHSDFEAPAAPRIPIPAKAAKSSRSLEEQLGTNWLNKLGIVALVIGVSLFLGRELVNFGPVGKSITGMTIALGILVGGLLLERLEKYRVFARAAIGGGWALTYFVTFALHHVDAMKVIPSQAFDLVLMMVVALAMVWHSLHYKSQVVTSLAFLLAFVTVGISDVTIFSLVSNCLLAVGLVYVAARERWFTLALCGLVGLYFNHFLWLSRVLPHGGHVGIEFPELIPSITLLLVYWLLFRLFYIYRKPETHGQEVVASFTAVFNSIGLMTLLKYQSSHPEWAFAGLLALGVAEMVFAFLARPRFRMGFLVLSTIASTLLLAAIPFRFSGSHWSLLWLMEAEMLFLLGVWLKERVFCRLGMIGGFAMVAQTVLCSFAPIWSARLSSPDVSRHLSLTVTLMSAAIAFWFNAEFARRQWTFLDEEEMDRVPLKLMSYVAAALFGAALYLFFPGAWVAIAWLVAMLLLGVIADWFEATDLAVQADLLTIAALLRLVVVNLSLKEHWGAFTLRAITVTIASVLLYLGMRRKTKPAAIAANYAPVLHSWAATALLSTLFWYEVQSLYIVLAWGAFALVLFELGLNLRRGFLRHQAYALLLVSFGRLFVSNLNFGEQHHFVGVRLTTVLPLIALYLWIYQRITANKSVSSIERLAANVAASAGMIAAAALAYTQSPLEWIAIVWAAMALLLLAVGWLLRRTLFLVQSLAMLAGATVASVAFNLVDATPTLAWSDPHSRIFCVGLACVTMLLALPIAFAVRRQHVGDDVDGWQQFTIYRPEQAFFFLPLGLLTGLIAVELTMGRITMGWSALGVVTFLFALVVKERSYRLAGLGLLMLGVAKVLAVDVWAANATDRYITLIVMGVALLSVSFLYSRYKETLLKFL